MVAAAKESAGVPSAHRAMIPAGPVSPEIKQCSRGGQNNTRKTQYQAQER